VAVVVRVSVIVAPEIGDELDAAVLDAACGEETIGHVLQLSRAPAHDDHLEASLAVEVNVERRPNLFAETVLDLREVLAEIAHVVIVNQGHRGDGRGSPRHLGAHHFGAYEIAQNLGAGRPPRFSDRIEGGEKRPFHGDAKPRERVFHGPSMAQLHAGQGRKKAPFVPCFRRFVLFMVLL
jgi:hypothetical protein